MKYIFCKRGLVFGILLLLIGTTIVPNFNSQSIPSVDNYFLKSARQKCNSDTIEVIIREHNGDGTFNEISKTVSITDLEEFKEKLNTAESIEQRLEIFKEYHFVSDDFTIKNINNCGRLDRFLKNPNQQNGSGFINLACVVFAIGSGIHIPIGTSLLTGFLNNFFFCIPSIDAMDIFIGEGVIGTIGAIIIPRGAIGDQMFFVLVGFLGISIRWWYQDVNSSATSWWGTYLGSSLVAFGYGSGEWVP